MKIFIRLSRQNLDAFIDVRNLVFYTHNHGGLVIHGVTYP
jgi:hypothetical protein